ncbi:RICIN domain-containing protein [Streptomyces sp. NPDC058409]|uniref:RICIN domain-containing protein n=1 Tax=Streptomyces sp. NPDC058409 TaxID=3346484 RepID=UPI00364F4A86
MRFATTPGRRVLTTLALAAAAVATASTTSASGAGLQNETFQIQTFVQKCLDVSEQSPADDTPIIQYGCAGTANQQFRIRNVGNGEFEIRTFADKCLDVSGQSPADDTPVVQYECAGTDNQRFRIVA